MLSRLKSLNFTRGQKACNFDAIFSTALDFVWPLFRIAAICLKSKINTSSAGDLKNSFPNLVQLGAPKSKNEA